MTSTRPPRFLGQVRQLFQLGSVVTIISTSPSVVNHLVAPETTTATAPLVFDSVTVIDVRDGHRIPAQRVVIAGNRISIVGSVSKVQLPAGALVVDARGKYLIPGLWDMHTHSQRYTNIFYPLFIANGVTGIRDAGTSVPLDSLILLRRQILAGMSVGPPRQILSWKLLFDKEGCDNGNNFQGIRATWVACFSDVADLRHLIDSVKAAGADMLKTYDMSRENYFALAAEARRIGIPFGGHIEPQNNKATAIEASDSGAGILDHNNSSADLEHLCLNDSASVERCRPVAEHFRRNNTWWVPTYFIQQSCWRNEVEDSVTQRAGKAITAFWSGTPLRRDWLHDSVAHVDTGMAKNSPNCPHLHIVHQVGLPIMAGTDVMAQFGGSISGWATAGFELHAELAMEVAEGLTPLEVLQAATLNPAKFIHATDSLGTVAAGKLADLVLLDADPLTDIGNITEISAVVANGRYFDRAALDKLLDDARTKVKEFPVPGGKYRGWQTDKVRLPPSASHIKAR
jgi:imidazolonepropionase-like amidohydrolase